MRKLVALTFLSLDGVMQGPGGKGEDPSDGFDLEGWTVPFFDEDLGAVMEAQMGQPFDLLLGRKTFDIFAAYWPAQGDDNPFGDTVTKYVVSSGPVDTDWAGTVPVTGGDVVGQIRALKEQDGPMLQVHGSSELLQTLLAEDLVDELWLKIFPVVLGKGKRLFGNGTVPASFGLTASTVSASGVFVATYARAGEVQVGSF